MYKLNKDCVIISFLLFLINAGEVKSSTLPLADYGGDEYLNGSYLDGAQLRAMALYKRNLQQTGIYPKVYVYDGKLVEIFFNSQFNLVDHKNDDLLPHSEHYNDYNREFLAKNVKSKREKQNRKDKSIRRSSTTAASTGTINSKKKLQLIENGKTIENSVKKTAPSDEIKVNEKENEINFVKVSMTKKQTTPMQIINTAKEITLTNSPLYQRINDLTTTTTTAPFMPLNAQIAQDKIEFKIFPFETFSGITATALSTSKRADHSVVSYARENHLRDENENIFLHTTTESPVHFTEAITNSHTSQISTFTHSINVATNENVNSTTTTSISTTKITRTNDTNFKIAPHALTWNYLDHNEGDTFASNTSSSLHKKGSSSISNVKSTKQKITEEFKMIDDSSPLILMPKSYNNLLGQTTQPPFSSTLLHETTNKPHLLATDIPIDVDAKHDRRDDNDINFSKNQDAYQPIDFEVSVIGNSNKPDEINAGRSVQKDFDRERSQVNKEQYEYKISQFIPVLIQQIKLGRITPDEQVALKNMFPQQWTEIMERVESSDDIISDVDSILTEILNKSRKQVIRI